MAEFLSPLETWADYEPIGDSKDINIIKEYQTEGYTVREFFFSAYKSAQGLVRAYAKLYFKDGLKKQPTVMFLGSPQRAEEAYKYLSTELGVNLFTFDYFGLHDSLKGRYTIYPADIAYANITQAQKDLDKVIGSPKDTAWYVWTSMARNALHLIKDFDEVDANRIGVMGIKTGANLAWKLAAIDDNVKCVVSLFNSGWLGYDLLYKKNRISDTELSEERAIYLAALSTQSYAPLVKKPILVCISTNDAEKTFDRAFDTYSRIPEKTPSVLMAIPHSNKEVYYDYRDNISRWLKDYLMNGGADIPKDPTIKLYSSDGKMYAQIQADPDKKIDWVKAYQSTEYPDPSVRNWSIMKSESIGGGEYLAKGEVLDTSEYFFAFALIKYADGYLVSTNLAACIPAEIKVTETVKASRLIYDSSMKTDCFFAATEGKIFHDAKELVMEKGPLDIEGVMAYIGKLATYKIGDPRYKGYEEDRLQISYYSETEQVITIGVREYKGESWGQSYAYTFTAEGNSFWSKLTLQASEFKNEDGMILPSFENVVYFWIKRKDKFLINSMLWV